MKLFSIFFISSLIFSQTIAYYVQPTPLELPSCGCGGSSPMYVDTEPENDVKYKFDFEVEQPKLDSSNTQPKSYRYSVQTPATESYPDDTKYQFDYTLQIPEESKLERKERTYSGRVEKYASPKQECTCKGGSCQCPVHGLTQKLQKHNGYVIPARYNDELNSYINSRSRRSSSFLKRAHRQTQPTSLEQHWDNFKSFAAKATEVFSKPSEAIKEGVSKFATHAQGIRDHFEKIASSPSVDRDGARERFSKFTSALHPDAIKERLSKIGNIDSDAVKERITKFTSAFDPHALKDTFTKLTDPLITHASNIMKDPHEFIKGFGKNFAGPVPANRERRSADTSNDNDRRYPVLKLRENNIPCGTIENLKQLSKTRVELQSPETLQYMPELANDNEEYHHCHKCGSQLSDSVCRSCGENHPQYVQDTKVMNENSEKLSTTDVTTMPRYVIDRYGRKYSNNNIRRSAPEYQETYGGNEPNYAGLRDILNQNKEIIEDLNPFDDPDRLIPQPIDVVRKGIDLIRDMARRSTEYHLKMKEMKSDNKKKYYYDEKMKKSNTNTPNEDKWQQKSENKIKSMVEQTPKTIYQVLPMNVNEHEGKLLVRVFSAKDPMKQPDGTKSQMENGLKSGKMESANETNRNMMNKTKPKPKSQKISKNSKDFEVFTFDESAPNTSDEEIQQILNHFYEKN